MARVFVELADTLDEAFDLYDRLAWAAVELLGVADAAVLVADERGRLEVVAATSERAWARRHGARSVCSLPLRLRDEHVGVLELSCPGADPLAPDVESLGQALADVATIALLQRRRTDERRVLVEQLTHALDSRIVLEQAKGMLAEQGRVGLDDAFERLRRYARDHNLELASVAQRVIARQLSFADLEGRAG